jgi:hypothetical protein
MKQKGKNNPFLIKIILVAKCIPLINAKKMITVSYSRKNKNKIITKNASIMTA